MRAYWRVLKEHPHYRRIYVSRTISLLGDWLNLLALLGLLRELGHNRPELIGALFIVKLLPAFLAGPAAGVVADRVSRKWIMIVSDLVRVAVVSAFFLVPYFRDQAVVFVLGLALVQAVASAFFEPARTACLPQILPPEDLTTANSLGALTWSVIYALGAALGGLITQFLGWRVALALDVSTYLFSAVFLVGLRLPVRPKRIEAVHWTRILGIRDVFEGLGYVRSRPLIGYSLCLKAGWCMAGGVQLLLTLFGERVFNFGGHPDLGTAFLFTARAAGTAFGPIIARRYSGEDLDRMYRAVWYSFFCGGFFYIMLAWVQHPAAAFATVFLAHLGGSTVWVFSTVLLQRQVQDRFAGRVFAAELGLATLMICLSTFISGALIERLNVGLPLLAVLLGSVILVAGVVAVWRGRKYRVEMRLPQSP
ncbi:MFS transporter [Sulfidibacter corallicola]|uniref:MFS transporter n=1 Tax=Sulfidibacter corallicola TaxID=2818388 RepID=A0A8A4TDD8_SULCO|nr:MFS transporter [Sulfidibacter corallicola]QTD48109.1 MFS transporter [Sulfidibacter corallicola]